MIVTLSMYNTMEFPCMKCQQECQVRYLEIIGTKNQKEYHFPWSNKNSSDMAVHITPSWAVLLHTQQHS